MKYNNFLTGQKISSQMQQFDQMFHVHNIYPREDTTKSQFEKLINVPFNVLSLFLYRAD